MMKEKLRSIVEDSDSRLGKIFDLASIALILYSLICLSLETLDDLPQPWLRFFEINEYIIVILFTLEFFLRFYVASDRKRFFLRFYSIVDLLAILPFYLGLGGDFQSIRALRFIRLIRLFKLARYTKSLRRYKLAFSSIKTDLVIFFGVTMILIYISAVGIYHFEHSAQPDKFSTIFDALWWAVATLTTVGYGDIYPITSGGRFFTTAITLIGIGIVAVPSGLMATALTEARQQDQ